MAQNKQFAAAASALLNDDEEVKTTPEPTLTVAEPAKGKRKAGRPKSADPGFYRTSFILKEEDINKVKYIALREGFSIKDIIEKAIQNIIVRYEEKNGTIILPNGQHSKNIDDLF